MRWGFRSLRLDLPYVLLGVAIGWNSDVLCSVKGSSMLPTLSPGDYVLFFPYALLRFLQHFSPSPLVRTGDVVVVRISPELTVCKRVMRTTADKNVMGQWNDEQFTTIYPEQIPSLDSADASPEARAEQEAYVYSSLAAYTRARDWDACIDRVEHPSGWLWLEGDNPRESFDSRNTGAVPLECLRGLVLLKMWPSFGRLPLRPSS
ncbi:mitochondrial inner membrane signal peptidase [Trypanosoma grayi]|uniref:mitochondrial inner membrane signal peptidase n=1 Tax=Trypanosoma grayi TaxID=71804 RepID=UPI0004F4B354|nr:mitochondrial inner membrane signal peptidase [Trypanosoma grayi]KEG12195.1 mitochondrial inner membrane signal peptidase [Trypanosoma grayi]